jgi:hypothetical protein
MPTGINASIKKQEQEASFPASYSMIQPLTVSYMFHLS